MTFTIAGIKPLEKDETKERITALLWGPAGVGKTTLAATAPGKKLYLGFDPDGHQSIRFRNDVTVVDLTQMTTGYVAEATKTDPFGVSKIMVDEGFDTLIVDSLTNFGTKAILHGIQGIAKATIINPSIQGWGARTGYTHQLALNLLQATAKVRKNLILIAHEGSPDKNDEGSVIEYPIGLGGQLPSIMPNLLSEVWYVMDANKERKIMIRPARMRKPMKTRMFKTTGEPEFVWKYNADTGVGQGIADWFNAWIAGGMAKLDLPK